MPRNACLRDWRGEAGAIVRIYRGVWIWESVITVAAVIMDRGNDDGMGRVDNGEGMDRGNGGGMNWIDD